MSESEDPHVIVTSERLQSVIEALSYASVDEFDSFDECGILANLRAGTSAGDFDENDPNNAYFVDDGQELAITWAAPGPMVRLFSQDKDVIAFGRDYLTIVAFNFVAAGIVFASTSRSSSSAAPRSNGSSARPSWPSRGSRSALVPS